MIHMVRRIFLFLFLSMTIAFASSPFADATLGNPPDDCEWESFSNRPLSVQPHGFFPYNALQSGEYMIYVGPAGKNGTEIPPKKWKVFGPYLIKAGNKYALILRPGPQIGWEENPGYLLTSFEKQPKSHATVYVRNDIGDQFYAVCIIKK